MQSRTRRPPARHSPRSCPNGVSGGLLSSQGASSPPAVAAVTYPPLVPGTGHIVHRTALPNCSGMLQGHPRVAAFPTPPTPHPPTPPSHCTSPALGQPAQPLWMPRGTQPSPMHPAASPGNQGCSGMGRSKNIPKFILESLSKAREQIRDFTLPMFLQLQHSCTARTSLF